VYDRGFLKALWDRLKLRNRATRAFLEGQHLRNTKVLYVEDDPALRAIMSKLLNSQVGIAVIAHVSNSSEALEIAHRENFDVALLDIALGQNSATGLELGLQLRKINPEVGIVIYSQHAEVDFLSHLSARNLEGWSTVQKSAFIDMPYLVDVLHSTARGLSVIDPKLVQTQRENEAVEPEDLTQRQHEIMALIVEGIDVPHISIKLGVSAVTIRQELSRIYKVLVPKPAPGTDLRTTAVLRYLRKSRSYAWANTE
jgi:two-component system, NarL family, response regulator DesR